jgi:hypothetical protein
MKRVIQQCSFLHHAPFATKRARPVQQRLFISLAFTRRKRARPVMHQSSDQAELLKLSSGRDRERYVTGYIRRMCMQGKEAFNRVGDKSMHARRWMDGWMDGCGGGAPSSRQRQRQRAGRQHQQRHALLCKQ